MRIIYVKRIAWKAIQQKMMILVLILVTHGQSHISIQKINQIPINNKLSYTVQVKSRRNQECNIKKRLVTKSCRFKIIFEIYKISLIKRSNCRVKSDEIMMTINYIRIRFINLIIIQNKMSIFKFFKKKENNGDVTEKLNVSNIFNKQEEVKKSTTNKNFEYNCSKQRFQNYQNVLKTNIVDLQKLKQLAWDGVPQNSRSDAWKLLLKYMPTNKDNQQQTLKRKRKDYFVMVNTYIENPSLQQDAQQKKIFKLINDDVLRTLPDSTLFRNQKVQKMMRRLLYVWHMRHPASGYVQGINDVVTPFIVVFLSEYVDINLQTLEAPEKLDTLDEQQLSNIEGDSYYCVSKLLDGILDNYTSSWPGIQKSFVRIQEVIKRVDPELLNHFNDEGIDFYHMYFKWVTCLLLRQFSMKICLRLFDTYLAIENNYFGFCLYILAAIILKYSKKFKKMRFEQMMIFQQNMPTKEWAEEDLSTVIAEAFVYQSYFLK